MTKLAIPLANDSTQQVRNLIWLMAAYYFLQGIGGNPGLHAQALDKYLVDHLALTATNKALFEMTIMVPFTIKPVWALFSDFLPIFGYRRKSYLIISGLISTVVCIFLAFMTTPPTFTELAVLFSMFMTSFAIADVVTDGVAVEQGNTLNITEKLQAAQWTAIGVSGVIIAASKGYIAQYIPLQHAVLLTVGFPILTIVITLLFLKEQRVTSMVTMQGEAWLGLKQAINLRVFWSCVVFLFLFNLSPNLGSVFYLHEKNILLFPDILIGNIDTVGSITGVLGFALFIPYFSKIERVTLFKMIIISGVISTLSFLFLKNAASAFIIIAVSSFIGAIAQIAILSLAAQVCPKNAEAIFFAALMSVLNLGSKGGGILGGMVYDYMGYTPLIYIGAGSTLIMWFFLPLIQEKNDIGINSITY